MSLGTPNTVETLRTSLQAKAKTEPAYRFYSLWDKVCREDVLHEAYRRCHANAGASGVDGETFDQIEAQGIERRIGQLRKELVAVSYRGCYETHWVAKKRVPSPRGEHPDSGKL